MNVNVFCGINRGVFLSVTVIGIEAARVILVVNEIM